MMFFAAAFLAAWSLVTATCAGECPSGGEEDAVEMLQAHLTHEGRLHEDAEIRGAGLTDDPLCEILRNATWPTGRVLCGDAQMQTYGWDVYNQECAGLTPRFLLEPQTVQDVQTAVKFAREHQVNISFRGSGHTYDCVAFKAGSLNIDLRTLGSNVTISYSGGSATAKMEPGVNFAKMFATLPSTLSFTHGTCESVGVMGYTLHGGWGATTSTWANESIVEIEVITADGELRTLNAANQGNEAKLWDAMHVAASSFGIVTNLTIQLFNHSERSFWFLPVLNSFDYLLSVLPDETSFGWIGLARWDSVFYQKNTILGSGWFLQIVLKDDSMWTKAKAVAWIMSKLIIIGITYQSPYSFPSSAETWDLGRYPFQTASVFTRFYPRTEIRGAAKLLEGFFAQHAADCRYNLGPIQGTAPRLPLVTVECNTPSSAELLKQFVKENSNVLQPNRSGSGYIKLPLDGSSSYRQAYFPQYAQLSATKCIWDPTDFFFLENGIHPSGCDSARAEPVKK